LIVGAEEIAWHPWSYDNADFVFGPLHCLALLEKEVGALDRAAAAGWAPPGSLPPCPPSGGPTERHDPLRRRQA
jgi:hypothetical protein